LGEFVEVVIGAGWRGILVVAFDVFAVMAGPPAARVTAEPGTVDVDGDVVPGIPCALGF
jgi:hypothetical protein